MTASTLVDLVKLTVASTGTGALTLGAAVPGYRGYAALTNGLTYSYSIQQDGNYEYGRGTYLLSGHQLIRSPLDSSNGGSPINLATGAQVAIVQLAEDITDVIAAQMAGAGAAQIAAIDAEGATQVGLVNAAGTTQVAAVNGAGSTQVAAVNSAGTIQVAAVNSAGTTLTNVVSSLAGGRSDGNPDPFFIEAVDDHWTANTTGIGIIRIGGLNGAGLGTIGAPRAGSPYPDGKQITIAGNRQGGFLIDLVNAGYAPGDVIAIGIQMLRSSGSSTSGTFCFANFVDYAGAAIGSTINLITAGSGTPQPLDTTSRIYTPTPQTVPSGARSMTITFLNIGSSVNYIIDALWWHKDTVPALPSDRPHIPRNLTRIQAIEAMGPDVNNVLVRKVDVSGGVALTFQQTYGTTNYQNIAGWAYAQLTSGFPAAGASGCRVPLDWIVDGSDPFKIFAEVRTGVITGTPTHPVKGRLVARGWITVDPKAGTAGLAYILFRDPVTNAVKTVTSADLDAAYTVAIWAVTIDGALAAPLFMPAGSTANNWSAFTTAYAPAGDPQNPGWGATGASAGWGQVDLVNITSPKEIWVPSTTFAGQIIATADDLPDLTALPKKVWCIVGQEATLFWDNVELRRADETNFLVQGLPLAAVRGDGIRYTPTSPGTVTATITPSRGGIASSPKTVDFIAVAANAKNFPLVVGFFGDSLVRNGVVLSYLQAYATAFGFTSIVLIGSMTSTQGSWPCVAADGTTLASYFGATLNGGAANPFYNGSSFSFPAFLANGTVAPQLSAASVSEPHFMFVEAGQVDTGQCFTDAAAISAASALATNQETIVQNILANSTATKVVVYTPNPGPIGGEGASPAYPIGYNGVWRQRRNWTIHAAQVIAAFSGREASRIYVTPSGAALDPAIGYNRQFKPRTAAIWQTGDLTFANYSSMSLAYGAGTICFVTDVAWYFVKQGGSGVGFWRPAEESDGFEWTVLDAVHYGIGGKQIALAHLALMKAV